MAVDYLRPEDIVRLLEDADWDQPDGAIYVREDLTLAEAEQSRLFRNARTILTALEESGGTKATQAGNLNRKFVQQMMEQLDLGVESWDDFIRERGKTVNEQDLVPLHVPRVLLELARLVRKYKGAFVVTKRGSRLRADDQAGALYALLFRTHFRRYNLGYLTYVVEEPLLQYGAAFSLLIAGRLMGDWRLLEDVAPRLVLPPIAANLRAPLVVLAHLDYVLYSYILGPLVELGVLEERWVGEFPESRHEMRKTALFDRVLAFNVEPQRVSRRLL